MICRHINYRVPMPPGIFIGKFSGPGKSWKMTLVLVRFGKSTCEVLESPGICQAVMWMSVFGFK